MTRKVIASWVHHDVAGFADLYTQEAFESGYKNSQVVGRSLDLRFLRDGWAVLSTRGGCLAPGESAVAEEQAIRASWVVVGRDGRWWIAACRNSPGYRPLPVPGS